MAIQRVTNVFLSSLVLLCYVRTHTASKICSNPPPGVSKIVRGVDITTLDLLPLGGFTSQGFKYPVLNFTCNRGNTWTSPSGKIYQRPDQIWLITSTPGGWVTADVNVFRTRDEARAWMNKKVEGDGEVFKFSFSASESYINIDDVIRNNSKFVIDVSAFESATRVDMLPDWELKLDTRALTFVDEQLSGTYETNKAAYQRFIQLFGTHYFSSANFGGFVRLFMKTDKYYLLQAKSLEEITAQARLLFFDKLSLSFDGDSHTSSSVSESFRQATVSSLKYYGGRTNVLASGGIKEWQPTVDLDPWLFSGKLQPISNLVKDKEKKTNLEKAVFQHVLRAKLQELHRLIVSAKAKVEHRVLDQLLENIEDLLKSLKLTQDQVESLSKLATYHLTVPIWFTEHTQLCYRWRAAGDKAQCGTGEETKLVCSRPNSRTRDYFDNTDGRSGGCLMQWGIHSSSQPAWFNKVKVCVTWYSDGDAYQCGRNLTEDLGMNNSTTLVYHTAQRSPVCAPVNSFTSEYLDDTNNRLGGCLLAWKVQVPPDVPLWLQTTKMCIHWSPRGNAGQCGSISGRSLCASTETWTPWYKDDTDNRQGGCQMSWELAVPLMTTSLDGGRDGGHERKGTHSSSNSAAQRGISCPGLQLWGLVCQLLAINLFLILVP